MRHLRRLSVPIAVVAMASVAGFALAEEGGSIDLEPETQVVDSNLESDAADLDADDSPASVSTESPSSVEVEESTDELSADAVQDEDASTDSPDSPSSSESPESVSSPDSAEEQDVEAQSDDVESTDSPDSPASTESPESSDEDDD